MYNKINWAIKCRGRKRKKKKKKKKKRNAHQTFSVFSALLVSSYESLDATTILKLDNFYFYG